MMAWRPPGDKPFSERMMIIFLKHMCFTRPQWVNKLFLWLYHNLSISILFFLLFLFFSVSLSISPSRHSFYTYKDTAQKKPSHILHHIRFRSFYMIQYALQLLPVYSMLDISIQSSVYPLSNTRNQGFGHRKDLFLFCNTECYNWGNGRRMCDSYCRNTYFTEASLIFD